MTEETGCLVALIISLGSFAAIGVLLFRMHSRNLQRRRRNEDMLRRNEDMLRNAVHGLRDEPINKLNKITDLGPQISQDSFAKLIGETQLLDELKRMRDIYLADESGRVCLARFFHQLGYWASNAEPRACAAFVVDIFYQKPDEWESHEYALGLLRSMVGIPQHLSDWIYRTTLALLERNPESLPCRKLGLEVGRWHLGRSREGGSVTIYDEQSIQNDLMVRSK